MRQAAIKKNMQRFILKELAKISSMANQHVVVIGAGSTGAAIHDLALRE